MRGIQGKVGPLGRRDGVVTRTEIVCNDGIGDDGDHEGVKRCPEDGVFLACVAHADAVVYITEDKLEKLVGEDTGGIGKAKE